MSPKITLHYSPTIVGKLRGYAAENSPASIAALERQHAVMVGLALDDETPSSLVATLDRTAGPVLTLNNILTGVAYEAPLTADLVFVRWLKPQHTFTDGPPIGVEYSGEGPVVPLYSPADNGWLDAPQLEPVLGKPYTFDGQRVTVRDKLREIANNPQLLDDDPLGNRLKTWLMNKGIIVFPLGFRKRTTSEVRFFPNDGTAGGYLTKLLTKGNGPAAVDELACFAGPDRCLIDGHGRLVVELFLHYTR